MAVPGLAEALALRLGRPEQLEGITWENLKDQTADGKPPPLDSTRTMFITQAPPTVCFLLNRYNPFTCEKLNDRFAFGHDLDLTPYLTPEALEKGEKANY